MHTFAPQIHGGNKENSGVNGRLNQAAGMKYIPNNDDILIEKEQTI